MWRPAIVMLGFFTLLTGLAYPAVVTWIGGGLFPRQAGGDVELLGQSFEEAGGFWGRPSAVGHQATTSAGTNLGPTNPALVAAVRQRVEALRAADPANAQLVPVDLVTASASGLDPHISPEAAYFQVGRVARARGLPVEKVRALVDEHVEGRAFGILGEPRVNVRRLNLALDRMASSRT